MAEIAKLEAVKNTDEGATPIRQMPQNIEAEQSLLGLLFINNEQYGKVNELLLPEDFFEPVHQRIYDSISKLIERGQIATPMVLKNLFDQDEALSDKGGAKYLFNLAKMAIQIHDAREIATMIRDLSNKRRLIEIGEEIVNDAFKIDIDKPSQSQIEVAEAELFALAEKGQTGKAFQPLDDSVQAALASTERAMKSKKHIVGVSTGFADLDNMLGGLQNSDLMILAGRPSMGKTALAVNIAVNAAKSIAYDEEEKGAVGLFSLEMSSEQIAMRILSMGTDINTARIRRGDVTEEDFAKLAQRSKELRELDIHVDDTPALSISAVRTRARRLKRRNNLRVLVVDYLQLLTGSGRRSNESRVQEISEITQGLKAIAKELNIPVIALSQLSRAVEQREDKRPQLSDLRESGSIEQDADVVMFIYREQYYLERKQPREEDAAEHEKWQERMEEVRNITDVIIGKQRNGPVGGIKLRFDGNTTSFENYMMDDSEDDY
jgi:replicative DNA helicase